MDSTRIDKWLWAARFFKTRSLATDEITKGRVHMAQHAIKPSKEIKAGDVLTIWQAKIPRTVVVKAVSDQRGPAPVAQQLYEETPQSIAKRAEMAEHNRLAAEPAHALEHGRPTKRDRRALDKGWGSRWSASLD